MATIINDADNTIISGTNEADSLNNNSGSNVTIYGYGGDDFISNGIVNFTPSSTVVSNVTINSGNGNDTISGVYTYDSSIFGGDGDDSIFSAADNNLTINAGTGNDYILLAPVIFDYTDNPTTLYATDFIVYNEGDGNDTVHGYSSYDTIKIDSTGTPSTVASGSDLIINVGEGSIRLVNATDTSITAINSSGDVIKFAESETAPTVSPVNTDTTVASGWATITSAEGTNIIADSVDNANATDNAETIQVAAISNTVRAVFGNGGGDVISLEGSPNGIEFSNATLDGGDGDDLIYINGAIDGIHPSTVSIGGGLGNDTIEIHGGNEGIHGGTAGVTDKSSVAIDGGDGDNKIFIHGDNDKGIDISNVAITSGAGNDLISIFGGSYGIGGVADYGNATVSINSGGGVDTISVNSINDLSEVSIVAGSGDIISVGSGKANYIFDSADAVTINGATFTANSANTSADLVSYGAGTSIGSAWNGTIALSGTNSLADIDGSIVSAAGNYQIVDGRFAGTVEGNDSVTPATVDSITPATVDSATSVSTVPINPNGKNYDVVFIIDTSGSMDYYINDVKNNVINFVNSLRNSYVGNIRFGLISYETDATAQTFSNNNYLTSDIDEFKTALSNLTTDGAKENGLTAVETAMSIVSDEDDTTKRFIVVTDEDYDDSDILNSTDVDNNLKSRGIVMDVIGREGSCQTEWEPLANNTGGKFYLLGEDFPSIFSDIATDMVNIIDLNTVPDGQTGYFVSSITSAENNTFTAPTFQANGATENETNAGAVNEVKVYVAESDVTSAQTVIIPEGWNVTATENDDVLNINGSNVTVTGGAGSDVFNLGSDVKTVSLKDLNPDEDKLSFSNFIDENSLFQSIEDGHLVLTADNLKIDLPGMSEMTEEFLDYRVSNAGTSSTISDLLYTEGRAVISFAQWNFGYNPLSSKNILFSNF